MKEQIVCDFCFQWTGRGQNDFTGIGYSGPAEVELKFRSLNSVVADEQKILDVCRPCFREMAAYIYEKTRKAEGTEKR
jgi:hypothetical protein